MFYFSLLFSEPALIAKSNIIFDVKPWDDETDMAKMEAEVRKIEADGLLWGAGNIKNKIHEHVCLQIHCFQLNWYLWPLEFTSFKFLV